MIQELHGCFGLLAALAVAAAQPEPGVSFLPVRRRVSIAAFGRSSCSAEIAVLLVVVVVVVVVVVAGFAIAKSFLCLKYVFLLFCGVS